MFVISRFYSIHFRVSFAISKTSLNRGSLNRGSTVYASISFRKQRDEKKENNLLTLNIKR